MTLNLNSKADMKGEVIKGLRMDITGVHHWGATPTWDHQLCILFGQWWLLEEECQITTWTWVLKLCPLINEKGQKLPYKLNPCHCIDFMALVRKVLLKKLDPPVKTFHGFVIALTSIVTKTGHNCEEIHIIFDTCREDFIKSERRGERNGILDVISPKIIF